MTIALVSGQTASAFTGSSVLTQSVTLPNNPTAGNLVCIGFATLTAGAPTFTSVQDGNSNAYTKSTSSPFNVNGTQVAVFYLPNAPSNANKTITATWTGTAAGTAMWAAEFSGAAVSPFERDASGVLGANNTNITVPSITTTNNGDLLWCVKRAGVTPTIVAPYIQVGVTESSVLFQEYMIQSTAGAQANTATQSSSNTGGGVVAAFTPAISPVGNMVM